MRITLSKIKKYHCVSLKWQRPDNNKKMIKHDFFFENLAKICKFGKGFNMKILSALFTRNTLF